MAELPALGPDDYKALQGLLMSEDAGKRAQGQALAKTLTPAEQQSFFDFQKAAFKPSGDRQDSNVATITGVPGVGDVGIPPEAATAIGAGMMGPAKTIAGRLISMGQSASPFVKYYATKSILRSAGLPEPLPEVAGWVVAGRGGKSVAAAAPETEAADAGGLSAADRASILKRYGPDAGQSIINRTTKGVSVESANPIPARVVSEAAAPVRASATMPAPVRISAQDFTRIKTLMDQGVPQDQAVALAMKLKGSVFDTLPTDQQMIDTLGQRAETGQWPK